jgi:ElaA protein
LSSVAAFDAAFSDLSVDQLYAILALRSEIFVVEQNCVYQDLDGRDREPGARHLWLEENGQAVAALRLLQESQGHRIGRLVTARQARGRGLAEQLIRKALASSEGPWILSGQRHLEAWYEGFGFCRQGEDYLEDGIPHVSMLRPG